jgi:hypothetical protein
MLINMFMDRRRAFGLTHSKVEDLKAWLAAYSFDCSCGLAFPLPRCPRPGVKSHPKVVLPAVFGKLCTIASACVRGASDQMSFLRFITSCIYDVIFTRQTRQTSFPHVIHMRACARGLIFLLVLSLYFEFVKKWSDQSDAANVDTVLWSDAWADAA